MTIILMLEVPELTLGDFPPKLEAKKINLLRFHERFLHVCRPPIVCFTLTMLAETYQIELPSLFHIEFGGLVQSHSRQTYR